MDDAFIDKKLHEMNIQKYPFCPLLDELGGVVYISELMPKGFVVFMRMRKHSPWL